LLEIIASAARLVPLDEKARDFAGAAMMQNWHIASIPDLPALQMNPQTKIVIVHVEKELVVHSTETLELGSPHHHEGTAHDRHHRRFQQRLLVDEMQALEVRMIGKQPVEP